ncbi:MAG TPA: non-homologous end-joining DNA ligase [Terrimicrobiaceae bacterium]|nr:non-homologous end-joining DNA ligase [Terrimicrobiaceae bacterium]
MPPGAQSFARAYDNTEEKQAAAHRAISTDAETPAFVIPMAAQVVKSLPEGENWIYELKFDGYRAVIIKNHRQVELRSRKNKDLAGMYPGIVEAGSRLNADGAVVDGEIVALDARGRPSFQALQHRGSHPDHQVVFYAFDLLHLDGIDLTGLPLSQRRSRLAKLIAGSGLLQSGELPGTVAAIVEAVRGLGLEGVIAKRKDSLYEPGERNDAWQKLKLEYQQEFVIGGYRPGSNGIDALLVGYHDDSGLRFAGKVRAGFVPHLRREVFKALNGHHFDECPFVDLPNGKSSRWGGGVTADEMLEMQWVKPALVAQIRFVEWTAEGRLRHAAFLGLRADKSAREVRRE